MKIFYYIITGALLISCETSLSDKKNNAFTTVDKEHNIYVEDFWPDKFTRADYIDLQNISNRHPERLDDIPSDIAYRLTSQDTIHSDFFCKSIDSIGIFIKVSDNYSNDFLVSFSSLGEPLDYLGFKGACRELIDGKRVYSKFYSDYFFLENFIVVNTLDTTEKVAHPSLAKILKTDYWYIDENGGFKKRE